MKKIFSTIITFSAIFSLFMILDPIFAANNKTLKYLPRDEAMESVNKDYDPPLIKSGVECRAGFDEVSRCFYCVQTLKPSCPDCCLNLSTRALRCTPGDNSIYNCKNSTFSVNNCSPVANCGCPTPQKCTDILYDCSDCPDRKGSMLCSNIPYCQQQGCPSIEPSPSLGNKCIYKDNKWICEEDKLLPRFSGCSTNIDLPGCPAATYYTTSEITDCQGLSSPPPNSCYEYTPTAQYQQCIDGCSFHANEWEKCTKRVYCCNQQVCDNGFENSCEHGKCIERIEWPECDNIELAQCIQLQQQALDCLTNPSPGSACSTCFEEIDPNLFYKFVARSRETIVTFWQVAAVTEFGGVVNASSIPTYFFTMVKIIDSNGKEVHRSIIHQKSFQGSFSIFSATSIDDTVLTQGETYTVRLYYFLPERLEIPGYENLTLRARINKAELIITRTRN